MQERLLVELEDLCRQHQPESIRGLDTPELTRVAQSLKLSRDELVTQAVTQIGDQRYREAANALLADPSIRFENLTARTKQAAENFNLGVDAFRRAGKGKRSNRSKVIFEVAQQVLAIEAQAQATKATESDNSGDSAASPATSSSAPDTDPVTSIVLQNPVETPTRPAPSRRSQSRLLVPAALIGIVVIGVLVMLAFRSGRTTNEAIDTSDQPTTTNNATASSTATSTQPPATTAETTTTAALPTELTRLMGEVDVTLHCVTEHGAGWTAAPDVGSKTGWACRVGGGASSVPADIQLACEQQYGLESEATNMSDTSASWRCATEVTHNEGACPVNAGDFNPSLANEQSPYAAGFRQRYDLAGGEASLGCPTQVMHQWAKGILQELEDESGNQSAILALDPHSPILLRGNAWLAYDRIKGLTGGLVGYPTNEPQLVDDTYQVQLSVGGALVASQMDAPFHWLPAVVYSRWQELGGPSSCLGMPISDPYTDGASFKQDFTSGLFSLSTVTGTMTYEGDTC